MLRILQRAFAVEAAWPQSPDHTRQLTAQAVADGFDVVAAMGGDGVAHHVGHVLGGTDTALGVIPTGTTNVFARLMGIPEKPAPAARLLAESHSIATAPLLSLEGQANETVVRHHALFAAGFGFDADVVRVAESEPYRKYRFGSLHYARTAITTLLGDYRRRRAQVKVRVGGETIEAVALVIQFQRVYTYFGPLELILGDTRQGTMTVLVAESLRARRLPRIGSTLLRRGDLTRIPGLRVWQGVEELHLEAAPPVAGQADGELTGFWSEARVVLKPDALRVIVGQP